MSYDMPKVCVMEMSLKWLYDDSRIRNKRDFCVSSLLTRGETNRPHRALNTDKLNKLGYKLCRGHRLIGTFCMDCRKSENVDIPLKVDSRPKDAKIRVRL